MSEFQCNACGFRYSDSANFTVCQKCNGVGTPPKECTCSYTKLGLAGVRVGSIAKINDNCPVHGLRKEEHNQ